MSKYILGSGISGLIAKYYNPDYKIISPDENIGGQLTKSKNILFTFYLHNDKYCKELLNELNVPYTESRIKIFYYVNKKLFENVDNKTRIKFIKNKMTEYSYDSSNDYNITDTNLSVQNNYLDILDVDMNLLLEKLRPKKEDIVVGKVKLINNNRKFMLVVNEKLNIINYDKLISTIPANDFFFLLYNYKSDYHFNYLPAVYVFSNKVPDFVKEYGMYYISDPDLIYNRINYSSSGCIYEITGMPTDDEIKKVIPEIRDIERRYIGVIKDEVVDDFRNIKFSGRLSQWKHSIKIQDNIRKAKEIKNNEQN